MHYTEALEIKIVQKLAGLIRWLYYAIVIILIIYIPIILKDSRTNPFEIGILTLIISYASSFGKILKKILTLILKNITKTLEIYLPVVIRVNVFVNRFDFLIVQWMTHSLESRSEFWSGNMAISWNFQKNLLLKAYHYWQQPPKDVFFKIFLQINTINIEFVKYHLQRQSHGARFCHR